MLTPRSRWRATATVDFGFHFVLGTSEQVEAIPSYVAELGVPSFKFFMNFRGDEGEYLGLPGNDDGYMYDLLGTRSRRAAPSCRPAPREHRAGLEAARAASSTSASARWRRGTGRGRQSWRPRPYSGWPTSPRSTGASVYAVHTSQQDGARPPCSVQRSEYENLFVETCTQYLTLDTSADCGTYGKVNPPLRHAEDVEALWEGVAVGRGRHDRLGPQRAPPHVTRRRTSGPRPPASPAPVCVLPARRWPRACAAVSPSSGWSTRPRPVPRSCSGSTRARAPSVSAPTPTSRWSTSTAPSQSLPRPQHSAAAYTPWEGIEVDAACRPHDRRRALRDARRRRLR